MMRSYTLTRLGSHIRFTEKARGVGAPGAGGIASATRNTYLYSIPRNIPQICDPYILWKNVPQDKKGLHSLEIQDMSGRTWYEIKSSVVPLDKMLTCHEALAKLM